MSNHACVLVAAGSCVVAWSIEPESKWEVMRDFKWVTVISWEQLGVG